jgi:hypothetical protein
MRLLYLINLFIVCCNSFIIQPAYLPMRFKPSNISYDTKYKNLKLQKKQLMIYNLMNLKKNNEDDNKYDNKYDNNDDNDEKTRKINNLIVNIIYNIILYSYISYYIATHNI